MRIDWKTEAALFLGAVIVRFIFYSFTGFTADDAFITYRYAENILAGNGFVYNIGDKVLGTSTPLFTFLLATLDILPGTVQSWALLISLIASGTISVILYRFAQSLRFAHFAALPAVLYICWPRSLPADISGMETAFFTLLITAALYAQQKQQRHWAIGLAAFATLTRIEGVLLLVLLTALNVYQNRSQAYSYIASPLLLFVPWMLFAWSYFGSFIPHSIPAKLALYAHFGSSPWYTNLIELLWLNTPVGWLLLIASIIGLRWLLRTQNTGRLATIWLVIFFAFFTFSNTHLFFWYVAPIYPIYLLIASAAAPFFASRYACSPNTQKKLSLVAIILSGLLLLAADHFPATSYQAQATALSQQHALIGHYLRTHAKDTDIVAAEDIGYIGYISKLRIIDRDGLVSPEVVPYNRIGDYKGVVVAFQPDWVVAAQNSPISGFINDMDFTAKYALTERFSAANQSDYLLFKRIVP